MLLHPVTDLTATELAVAIRAGEVTCAAATTALCLRAALAGEVLFSNAEEMFAEGVAAAVAADTKIAETGGRYASERPLLGVPVSVKDCVHVKGWDATSGAAVSGSDAIAQSNHTFPHIKQ
jgi:amidase